MIDILRTISENKNLDALLITAPDNIEYLINASTVADATLLLTYNRKADQATLYVPLLEYYRYRHYTPQSISVYALSRTLKPEDILVIEKDWKDIISEYKDYDKIGVDISHISPLQRTIQSVLGEKIVDVSNELWKTRMIKTTSELEAIIEATRITIKGILAVYSETRDNVTEATLAGIFEKTVRDHGVEKMAFDPIIAFKPNNAYPHTLPGNRPLTKRDLVLIDVGVKYKGRCSDITRMIIHGRPLRDEKKSIEAVSEAVNTAIDSIQPGVKAGEIFEKATKTLEKYGLRNRFIHGLGHGIGILVHEPPYLRQGSDTILEPGMVFTIEPGVYFPGKYGIRIEELVVVTKKGVKIISRRLESVLKSP